MRTVAEHQAAVRALLAPLANREPVWWTGDIVTDADRRAYTAVLAADLFSPIDHPPFDNSQMDGYAVRSAEIVAGQSLRVAPRVAAGHPGGTLNPGEASPIMTGAPVPAGADSIIPIELATPDHFPPEEEGMSVSFAAAPQAGSYVRRRGSDLARGELLLKAGTRLGSAQWGVIAASGIGRLPLLRPLRVLVLSTGDELHPAGSPLGPGQIHDANSAAMTVALAGAGAVAWRPQTVTDDADAMRSILAEAAVGADLILTTGGVSQGAYEVVRDVFDGAGVLFESIGMQPGGPQGLGIATLDDGSSMPVVAFPGNPVSALISFELFLRPVLRQLHGLTPHRDSLAAPLAAPLDSPPAKHQVRRGRIDADGRVALVGGPSSHLLHGYALATHLIHVPLGVSHLEAGDLVDVWSLDA